MGKSNSTKGHRVIYKSSVDSKYNIYSNTKNRTKGQRVIYKYHNIRRITKSSMKAGRV